jgi:hypothetical protein
MYFSSKCEWYIVPKTLRQIAALFGRTGFIVANSAQVCEGLHPLAGLSLFAGSAA